MDFQKNIIMFFNLKIQKLALEVKNRNSFVYRWYCIYAQVALVLKKMRTARYFSGYCKYLFLRPLSICRSTETKTFTSSEYHMHTHQATAGFIELQGQDAILIIQAININRIN
jgi:hypothetical protein